MSAKKRQKDWKTKLWPGKVTKEKSLGVGKMSAKCVPNFGEKNSNFVLDLMVNYGDIDRLDIR